MSDENIDYESIKPENISKLKEHGFPSQEKKYLGLEDDVKKGINLFIGRGISWVGNVFLIALVIVFAIRMLHLILPACWLWLSTERIKEMDSIFMGLIAGLSARLPNFSKKPTKE